MNKIIKLFSIIISSINGSYLYNMPTSQIEINTLLIAKNNFCANNSPFILNILKNDINKEIVKELSGLLPLADIISKKVLEWNDIWIEKILDSRIFPEEYKKVVILELINIVQNGDNAGSGFLESYKNIVDCLLP